MGSTLVTGFALASVAGAGAANAASVNIPQLSSINVDTIKASTSINIPRTNSASTSMKTTAGLNLRSTNSTRGKVLKVLPKNTVVQVLATKSGWKKVKAGSLTGWVSADYLTANKSSPPAKTTSTQKSMKTTANVNLRASNNTKSKVIKVVKSGTTVQVIEKKTGWTKVKSGSSQGWISASYLTSNMSGNVSPTSSPSKNDGPIVMQTRAKVIGHAKANVGVKYKWGGTSPSTGWDCSGYIQYVFKKSGVTVPRTKAWVGKQKISKSQAKPGDLVVQYGGSHVGIYAGNDKMYHAANPKTGTVLAPTRYAVDTAYYRSL